MSDADDMISINVTVDIAASTLQTIVKNAKKIAGADAKGIYRVDTAEKVNELVTSFLKKSNFDEFVKNPENYNQ